MLMLPAADCVACHTPAWYMSRAQSLLALPCGQQLSSVSNRQLSCCCRYCLAHTKSVRSAVAAACCHPIKHTVPLCWAQNKPCSSRWQLDIQFNYMVLCRCKNVHDEGFAGLASLTGLTALDVSECATLSDVGLGALVDKLVGLQELNLHGCIHVTDAGERSVKMGTWKL